MKKLMVLALLFTAPLYASQVPTPPIYVARQFPSLDLHVSSEYLNGPQNSVTDTGKGSKDIQRIGFIFSLPIRNDASLHLGADKVTESDNFVTTGFNGVEHTRLDGYKIELGIKIEIK